MRSVAHVFNIHATNLVLLMPQLRALQEDGFDVSIVGAPGPSVEAWERQGIRYVPWTSVTRGWDLRADVRAFRELVGILRRERFDVVHTHAPKIGVIGRIAARVARVPCVLNTVHGFYATREDRFTRIAPVMAVEWLAARFSDFELYQSHEDFCWGRRLGIARPGRSAYVGSGTDLRRFPAKLAAREASRLRRELGIGDGVLVVGMVGRMVREKGAMDFFEAAKRVRRLEPRACFLVVGEPDLAKQDAIEPREVDLARDDVLFTGWRDDVPEIMSLMDVFVLPSWREGLPRAAIEAAASGLPIVLTDIRGCREVVRQGVEGLLVPVRDPERLSDAILELLRDPVKRDRMGRAARERAEQVFDERRVCAAVVDVTRTQLGRTSPRGSRKP